MPTVRRSSGDLDDVVQHLQRLQIARVEPAEPVLAGEELHHRRDPLRIIEGSQSPLLCWQDGVCEGLVKPLFRVALAADRIRDLGQLLTSDAVGSRQAERLARHLASVTQPANQLDGYYFVHLVLSVESGNRVPIRPELPAPNTDRIAADCLSGHLRREQTFHWRKEQTLAR